LKKRLKSCCKRKRSSRKFRNKKTRSKKKLRLTVLMV